MLVLEFDFTDDAPFANFLSHTTTVNLLFDVKDKFLLSKAPSSFVVGYQTRVTPN